MALYIFYFASFILGCIISIFEHEYMWIPQIAIVYLVIGFLWYRFMMQPFNKKIKVEDDDL